MNGSWMGACGGAFLNRVYTVQSDVSKLWSDAFHGHRSAQHTHTCFFFLSLSLSVYIYIYLCVHCSWGPNFPATGETLDEQFSTFIFVRHGNFCYTQQKNWQGIQDWPWIVNENPRENMLCEHVHLGLLCPSDEQLRMFWSFAQESSSFRLCRLVEARFQQWDVFFVVQEQFCDRTTLIPRALPKFEDVSIFPWVQLVRSENQGSGHNQPRIEAGQLFGPSAAGMITVQQWGMINGPHWAPIYNIVNNPSWRYH